LKRYRVISFPFNPDTLFRRFPLKTSLYEQQKLLKKCEDSDLEYKPIRLTNWQKAGLEDLLINPLPQKKN
jgi:hypothetical protein